MPSTTSLDHDTIYRSNWLLGRYGIMLRTTTCMSMTTQWRIRGLGLEHKRPRQTYHHHHHHHNRHCSPPPYRGPVRCKYPQVLICPLRPLDPRCSLPLPLPLPVSKPLVTPLPWPPSSPTLPIPSPPSPPPPPLSPHSGRFPSRPITPPPSST